MSVLFPRLHKRVLPFLLAMLFLMSTLPLDVFSATLAESNAFQTPLTGDSVNGAPSAITPVYDYDTLFVSMDGKRVDSLTISSHEKVEISADGLDGGVNYQWQIQHNENDELWVNIFDATGPALSVSKALVGNLLRADGTVKLRCRAYSINYAYLTYPVTVTIQDSEETIVDLPTQTEKLPSLMASGDEIEFVTVTINYVRFDYLRDSEGNLVKDSNGDMVLNDGVPAFSSYIATLLKGNKLSTTVVFPILVGYEAYWEKETTSSLKKEFSDEVVNESVVYTVSYKPTLVNFSIRFFFQNVYDDQYVENPALRPKFTGTGYTGSTPDEDLLQPEIDGFTALYYQPDSIAADGSTVFEVYFERNYYLMEFNCNGGYGTETLYVRYGSYIAVPNPVKPGYAFSYWDLQTINGSASTVTGIGSEGGEDELPSTMPSHNCAYKAAWATVKTTYTVVYWAENANDNDYSYWGTATVNADSASKVSGTEHSTVPNTLPDRQELVTYFTYNHALTVAKESERDDLIDGKVVVEGDGSTIVNVYFKRNVYTITFLDDSISTCQIPEHDHTADCYEYLCHTHTADCYKCKKEEHSHSSACCSLYHVHEESCAGSCDHTAHTRACYTFTGGTVATTPTTVNNPTSQGTYGGLPFYRTGNVGSRVYYVLIDGSYYIVSNFNNNLNNVKNTVNCSHVHKTTCYNCGLTVHDHTEGTCNLANCVNGGEEHDHVAGCYLCGKDEVAHTEACCSREEHTHVSCSPSNCSHTTHSRLCYTFTGGTVANSPTTGISPSSYGTYGGFPIYRRYDYNNYEYVYYALIHGSYYEIDNFNRSNFTSTLNCSHVHSDACYSCGKDFHDHSANCNAANCTAPELHHAHSSACFPCDQGHTHSAACPQVLICGKVAHTHSTDDSKFDDKIVKILERKYGAYIGEEWEFTTTVGGISYPKAGDTSSWNPEGSSTLTQRLALIDIMPGENFRLTYYPRNESTRYYNYYIECLEGEEYDVEYNGRKYKHYFEFGTLEIDFTKYTEAEDFFPIEGFTKYRAIRNGNTINDGTSIGAGTTINFYYNRNTHRLDFYNRTDLLKDEDGNVINETLAFQEKLQPYQLTKEQMEELYYPSKTEPGAFEFAGWYWTGGFYPGTEVDWTKDTMPDGISSIYAKWVPVVRTVTFYSAYPHIKEDEEDTTDKIYHFMLADKVPHGTELGSAYLWTPDHPEDKTLAHASSSDADLTDYNESQKYDFVGWFYMDENNKKRFAPDTMEVTRDLVLFAEWQTSIDTTYHVTYVLRDNVGGENTPSGTAYPAGTEIAEFVDAHSSVGKTKTFEAKSGSLLYEDFRKHFFPMSNSHSILMGADPAENVYSFEYAYDDRVFFKIRYLEQGTNEVLHEAYENHTDEAIITQKFLPIEGYLPTSYYITRSLQYDGNATSAIEENTFTFYYVKDSENGLFSIEYYWENVDSTDASNVNNYTMQESIVGKEPLGEVVVAPDRSSIYADFGLLPVPKMTTVITYKDNGEVKNEVKGGEPKGTVEYTGLTIKLYFRRDAFDYTIRYVEYGGDVLHSYTVPAEKDPSSNNWTPKVDSTVGPITAPDTYTVIDSGGHEMIYRFYPTEEKPQTQTLKIRENESDNVITFYFKLPEYVIHYEARCVVDGLTNFGFASPNMDHGALITNIGGSTATELLGFRFVEWRNASGTVVSTEKYFKPSSFAGADADGHIYYYAYFEPIYTQLTLTKEISTATEDAFLFRIKGQGKFEYIDLTVAIHGAGSLVIQDLPVGTYTITELTDWSWEYTAAQTAVTITVTETGPNVVTFTNTANPSNWLTDETYNENQFDPTFGS